MSQVEELAKKIQLMKPADRLKVAAGLIERGAYSTAEPIVGMVYRELQALSLLRAAGRKP